MHTALIRRRRGGVAVSRRNLLIHTGDFSAAAWTFQFATRNGLTTDPDGGNTAQLVTFNSQFANVRQKLASPVTDGDAVVSCWIKRISGNTSLSIRLRSAGSLYLGSITITDSWQRFSYSRSHDGSNDMDEFVIQDRNASGHGQIAIWHPQFETGSAPTDYQEIGASF